MRSAGLTLLMLIAWPSAAYSQDAKIAENVDEGENCLAIAHRWAGSIEDTRLIRSAPVPESYRRPLEAGGCAAWQLVRESLLDWHLAYGDEKSAYAGIQYLEDRMLAGKPVRADLGSELAALTGKRSGKHARSGAKGQSVDALVETAHAYRILAMEYARAADFYNSPLLLAKAETLAKPSLSVGVLLRASREEGTPCQVGGQQCEPREKAAKLPEFDDYEDRKWRDLDLQLAVARARIGGTENDFAAARAMFVRNDDPHYDTAGDEAFMHGDNFCDIGDASHLSSWKEACDEDNFDRRALSYWRYRAVFSAIAQAADQEGLRPRGTEWDGEIAIRLIQAEERARSSGLPELYFGAASYAVTDIRFALAERQYGKARRKFEEEPRPGRTQAEADLDHSLNLFWQAATYVQGTTHPGWLRRIGLRYLEVSETLERARDPDDPLRPSHARRIAWFRMVLPQLEELASGEFNYTDH